MKLIKILTFFLSLVLIISPVFSQGSGVNTGDLSSSSEESDQQDKKTADPLLSDDQNISDTSVESASVKASRESAEAIKKEQDKTRIIKNAASQTEKKVPRGESEKIPEKSPDDDSALLRVDEGAFKYSRIPEIVINEPKPSDTAAETRNEEVVPDDEKAAEGGFLGMRKETADVVAKGGILLLILVIFILYKSRMKGTGKRGPGRNVLNSYRK